jgi:hypothetical protein
VDRDKPIYHAACNNEALADEHTVFRKTIRHLLNNISQRVALPVCTENLNPDVVVMKSAKDHM